MQPRLLFGVAVLDVLFACTTLSAQDDVPALIVAPDAASREELSRVVSAALGGAPVTLADDALVHDDRLVIERARVLDPAGRRIDGRSVEPPEQFRLVISGSRCLLIREADGSRLPLDATRCRVRSER